MPIDMRDPFKGLDMCPVCGHPLTSLLVGCLAQKFHEQRRAEQETAAEEFTREAVKLVDEYKRRRAIELEGQR